MWHLETDAHHARLRVKNGKGHLKHHVALGWSMGPGANVHVSRGFTETEALVSLGDHMVTPTVSVTARMSTPYPIACR